MADKNLASLLVLVAFVIVLTILLTLRSFILRDCEYVERPADGRNCDSSNVEEDKRVIELEGIIVENPCGGKCVAVSDEQILFEKKDSMNEATRAILT